MRALVPQADLAVVFGSGLALVPDGAEVLKEIDYAALGWPATSVAGHANRLRLVWGARRSHRAARTAGLRPPASLRRLERGRPGTSSPRPGRRRCARAAADQRRRQPRRVTRAGPGRARHGGGRPAGSARRRTADAERHGVRRGGPVGRSPAPAPEGAPRPLCRRCRAAVRDAGRGGVAARVRRGGRHVDCRRGARRGLPGTAGLRPFAGRKRCRRGGGPCRVLAAGAALAGTLGPALAPLVAAFLGQTAAGPATASALHQAASVVDRASRQTGPRP